MKIMEKVMKMTNENKNDLGLTEIAYSLVTYAEKNNRQNRQKVYELAAKCYTVALAIDPNSSPAVHNNRGVAFVRSGRCKEAIDSFDKAIQRDPEYARAYANRGIANIPLIIAFCGIDPKNHMAEWCPSALEDFDNSIRLDPNIAEVHFYRSCALYACGRYQEAIESWDAAVHLDAKIDAVLASSTFYPHTDPPNIQEYLRILDEAYKSAVDELKRINRLEDGSHKTALAHIDHGSLLMNVGKYKLAIKSFDKATRDPNLGVSAFYEDVNVYLLRANVYEALGQKSLALRDYKTACTHIQDREESKRTGIGGIVYSPEAVRQRIKRLSEKEQPTRKKPAHLKR